MLKTDDTIVALATPPGRGGIGIIRLSGPEARRIGLSLFRPARSGPLIERRLTYGWIREPGSGRAVDEVLAVFMAGPKTYTRQDIFEIQAHGGPMVLRRILALCLAAGARPAEPGEYTWRAYMAGRIDLAQAEAVAELIEARTEAGARVAAGHLAGGLSEPVAKIVEAALDVLAEVEAGVDFPEEDLEVTEFGPLAGVVAEAVLGPIDRLIEAARAGRHLRDGARVVLIGRPNVGKSSLLNALLARPRALVTDVPGTTRDYLEESLDLDGLPVVLTDTAGLRRLTDRERDRPEAAGIEATRRILSAAELIVLVVDATSKTPERAAEDVPPAARTRTIVAANKCDLSGEDKAAAASRIVPDRPGVVVSALTGYGLENLKSAIRAELVREGGEPDELGCAPSLRQEEILVRARQAFDRAREGLAQARPAELVAVELKEGLDQLGRITGRTTPEAVLDRIFSRFCIGK